MTVLSEMARVVRITDAVANEKVGKHDDFQSS